MSKKDDLRKIVGELNFLTGEHQELMKSKVKARGNKVKISVTIPSAIWFLLQAAVAQGNDSRSRLVTEGLEMYFEALPPEELNSLKELVLKRIKQMEMEQMEITEEE